MAARVRATTVISCVAEPVSSRPAKVGAHMAKRRSCAAAEAATASATRVRASSLIDLQTPEDGRAPARGGRAQAPPFSHSVSRVTAAGLPHSWHSGCPVAPASLRRLRLAYWGFDGRAHTGALIVNAKAVGSLTRVFSRLYAARFPLRRMRPIDAYGGSDERSLAADNTAAFNCRYAVASGPKRWSVHAYGLAVDVNPVESPYVLGGRVHPRAGRAYINRSRHRAGMAVRRRPAREHLRLRRLAVGRALDGLARLPALLGDGWLAPA